MVLPMRLAEANFPNILRNENNTIYSVPWLYQLGIVRLLEGPKRRSLFQYLPAQLRGGSNKRLSKYITHFRKQHLF